MTYDEGEQETTQTPSKTSADYKTAEEENERAKALGFVKGAVVARKYSREQVLNPWTWGIVIFNTAVRHLGDVKPIGVVFLSSADNREIAQLSVDDLLLVNPAPSEQYLLGIRKP